MKNQTRSVLFVAFILIFASSSAAKVKPLVPAAPIPTIAPAAKTQASNDEVQGLVIAIRPSGFSPAEVDVTEGRYVVLVQNRSGIRNLTFRVDSESGERLHQVRPQELQWKKTFDLHPGRYVLSVVGHSSWRCLLTVTPR